MRGAGMLVTLLTALAASVPVHAGQGALEPAIDGSYWDEDGSPAGEAEKHSPRYRRMIRDLQRQYQEGSLTRTEYIQRMREIKALGEK